MVRSQIHAVTKQGSIEPPEQVGDAIGPAGEPDNQALEIVKRTIPPRRVIADDRVDPYPEWHECERECRSKPFLPQIPEIVRAQDRTLGHFRLGVDDGRGPLLLAERLSVNTGLLGYAPRDRSVIGNVQAPGVHFLTIGNRGDFRLGSRAHERDSNLDHGGVQSHFRQPGQGRILAHQVRVDVRLLGVLRRIDCPDSAPVGAGQEDRWPAGPLENVHKIGVSPSVFAGEAQQLRVRLVLDVETVDESAG